MASQSLSPEVTSYARLCLAINDVCTKCLRAVLLRNVPNQDIKQAIVARWGYQYQGRNYLEYPYSTLFPNRQLNPNFSVSDCDLSLLYFLIRNVSSVKQPLLGWGQSFTNNPQDTSIGANVERLRELRNTVIHLQEPRISNQDFLSYWNQLRDCVTDIDRYLGDTMYQEKLECLKTADMDPNYANRIIELFRICLQDLQAGQHDYGQTLSDFIEGANQEFLDIKIADQCKIEKLSKVEDLINDGNRQLPQIAKAVNETNNYVKVMYKFMEGKAKENDQTQSQLKSYQGVRTENTTSNQDEQKSEITLDMHNSRDPENTTDCNTNRIEKTDIDESSRSESVAVQVQLNTNDVLVKVNQDTNGGIEIGDLASGLDGKLCITKQYAFIKPELTRESGLVIAKCLLEQNLLSQDAYDRMGNPCCARRHPIDILLKKVLHGGKEETVEAFFKRLKIECPLIARAVKETTITEMDRLKFSELEASGIKKKSPFGIKRSGISKRDVRFFKYHLCESEEVVEHITDVMLSRFHFSILDHTRIINCPTTEERISALFKRMQLFDFDAVTELSDVVQPILYQKWMESRSTQGSRLSRLYRWMKKSKTVVNDSFKPEEMELKEVERGSIILRFIAGVNFSVDLLKPESLKMKIKTLLERGFLEGKTEPKSVAHVTVYIESPPNKGLEEIHFYIDFHATDVSMEAKDHQVQMKIRNRDIMSEEMNPARLKQWMLDQPCIQKLQRDMLESKLSERSLFRQEEMTVLLDFINGLENGDHLLETYCEKNDIYVYNKVFRKHREFHSHQEKILGHRAAVTYVKGGGLQELFSFSIIFDNEDMHTDTEEDIHTDTEEDIETDTEEDEDEQIEEIMQKLKALLPMHEDEEQQLKKLIQKKEDKDPRREDKDPRREVFMPELFGFMPVIRDLMGTQQGMAHAFEGMTHALEGMAHPLEDEDEQIEEIMLKLEALLPMHEDEEQQLKKLIRKKQEDLQKQRELIQNSLDLMGTQQGMAHALEELKPVLEEIIQKNLDVMETPQDEEQLLKDTEQDLEFDDVIQKQKEFLSKLQEIMLKYKDKEQQHEDSERVLKEIKPMQRELMRMSLGLIKNPQVMERHLQQAMQDPKGFMQNLQGLMQKQQGIVQTQQELIQMQQECILQLQEDIREQEPIQKQEEWMLQFAEDLGELQESIRIQQDLMQMQQDLMRMHQEWMLQLEGNILEKKEPIQRQQDLMPNKQETLLQIKDLIRKKQETLLEFKGNIEEKLRSSEMTQIIKQTSCDEVLSSENIEM